MIHLPFIVREDVDMDSYKIVDKGEKQIILGVRRWIETTFKWSTGYQEEEKAKLSQIIKDLNDAFGTDFTDDDRVFLERVKANLLGNEELLNKMEHNSPENVKAVFDKYFNREMTGIT